MLSLLILPWLPLQTPPPEAPAPASSPAVDPRELYTALARRLERSPVIHLQAEGVLVTADKANPGASVRWSFDTEVWMAKGGKVNARTRWTGPRPEQGEPERFTAIALANGLRAWQGFEGPQPLEATELSRPRFVPYPLPEVFALFDGKLETELPAAQISKDFDWGKPERTIPTVIVVDPLEPASEPAFWYGFAKTELAGWCAM